MPTCPDPITGLPTNCIAPTNPVNYTSAQIGAINGAIQQASGYQAQGSTIGAAPQVTSPNSPSSSGWSLSGIWNDLTNLGPSPDMNLLGALSTEGQAVGSAVSSTASTVSSAASGIGNLISIVTDVPRMVTLLVGLVLIAGGLYVLSTSAAGGAIANAIESAKA
jgi:hypothetical protein